ncbi:MAG: nucleotidyltransferase domain-containing protein [Chloroflexota bacterium]|nr:nucleotidyltransferase domain-containing protein [Chloroflexota bacterium]MDP9472055.1 nucleotidyltransferase domain-containing protein [Chloroflexota bacterium]
MNPLIESNLDAIRALCREYGVAQLEIFGSATTDRFDPDRSDIDFIIEYPPDYDFGHWLTRYFELKERLETLLGRPVDLVMAGAMRNPRFIQSANESRQILYAA